MGVKYLILGKSPQTLLLYINFGVEKTTENTTCLCLKSWLTVSHKDLCQSIIHSKYRLHAP